jgi:uncharacterized repeat protein (TIGR01451 family)
MTTWGRRLFVCLFAVSCAAASGCFGVDSNPSYFPYILPSGDVIQTHAKPISPGYYANFDPQAAEVVLVPTATTSQVGTQVIVLATVKDAKGVPLRSRRVDWMVSEGNLVEVDESGVFPGRGGILGNRGFSYTSYGEHRLSRGNASKLDDVMVRPGQSWCVVSSPVEGDTHVQIVVPGIYNWDKRMQTAVIRWVDATWEFPPHGLAKFGTEHEFVTKVARFTDRQPLAKYRVHYKILDGPPAMLLPARTQEYTAVTDLNGHASVKIAQLTPASGINRVSVEIIRPPDPTAPTGSGVSIVTGETAVEWQAPDVKLGHTGPAAAPIGQNIVYTTTATNAGRIDSQWVILTLPIPDGLEFVNSNPPATPENGQLIYTFGALGVSQMHTVQTTFRSTRPGLVKSVALMRTAENQNDQKDVNTTITTPQLKVDLGVPNKTGIIDVPINYTIRLSNPGSGDLDEIQVLAQYDPGLEHDKQSNQPSVSLRVAGLRAGETRDQNLTLTPRKAGALGVKVTATSGGLSVSATQIVTVTQPKVSLRVDGPSKRYVGRPAEWKIYVKNDSDADLSGLVVRDRLPAELQFKFAGQNGVFAGGEVTWNIGALKAGAEVPLDLITDCQKAAVAAEKLTMASADGNARAEKSAKINIDGIAALKMVMAGKTNPVEIGKNVIYEMTLTNTGSAAASNITVKATPSPLLKAVGATGPTKEAIAGGVFTFDKVDSLQPGQTITFRFECQAVKDGDARFRTEYTSDLNPVQPIYEEEPTRVVAPLGATAPLPKQ